MSYQQFAYLYDRLMNDVPYDKWVELVKKAVSDYKVNGANLLDLACGTGELSIRFSQAGFRVTGVDLSEDMLSVAQAKTIEAGEGVFYLEQDMSRLEGLPVFDLVCICCDSINYLRTEEDVINTFKGVYEHLDENGLFIFDVHSLYKMNQLFINQTYAVNDEDLSLIWQCYEGENPNSVEHDLSFFELDEESGMYHRYDELHFQRTYSVEQYSEWLDLTGFSVVKVEADFSEGIEDLAERIFFYCKKKEMIK
ncbi:class I SAM-dependent methyltransferase [Cytobacillus oceanisediminis]|jgi:SAM-dependent methyltransferase|uniref:Class I SAM-dependent methyltransferase n=2 Tax=Niallia TaxID=2837506 RepID=A0A941GDS1_NIACI|nr:MULTISPECIES: class I SAM-dependent methyltransferase [Bacillaceae]EOR23706.1 CheR-type MCP methyltransferase [Niallia nealsonii AAU1]MBQ6447984.1 class I SAM-dependent methyltransferase [Bacillus sp. (in: firmicutes)]MDU1844049.1 class I SAM-dependent methyltransferase [Niallia nealsonii]MBZ9533027.1 class I SAM-dependent methyltransferase [Cytobacillus oceanisediminis]MCB5235741.1 class I SAM-dependent methyltransferase [Niallia circulans]